MFPLILAAFLGQAPAPQPKLEKFHLLCPEGHKVYVWARDYGGEIVAKFPQPIDPTRPNSPKLSAYATNGVTVSHMPHLAPGKSWHGGNVEYVTAIGAPNEKPNRVHLTFIGSQVEREAARKDLERNPGYQQLAASMGDYLAVQDYGPENPLVAEIGLVGNGKPDVVIQQTKGGKVVYRATSYAGADTVTNEIRRADPRYSPKDDPGGGTLGFDMDKLFSEPSEIVYGLLLGVGAIVILGTKF